MHIRGEMVERVNTVTCARIPQELAWTENTSLAKKAQRPAPLPVDTEAIQPVPAPASVFFYNCSVESTLVHTGTSWCDILAALWLRNKKKIKIKKKFCRESLTQLRKSPAHSCRHSRTFRETRCLRRAKKHNKGLV